jgi:hypothetical protein
MSVAARLAGGSGLEDGHHFETGNNFSLKRYSLLFDDSLCRSLLSAHILVGPYFKRRPFLFLLP